MSGLRYRLYCVYRLRMKFILKILLALAFVVICVHFYLGDFKTKLELFPEGIGLRPPDRNTRHEFLPAVIKFYQKCQSLGITLFVLDAFVLKSFISKRSLEKLNSSTITFGIFDKEKTGIEQVNQGNLEKSFKDLGFTLNKKTSGRQAASPDVACFLFRYKGTRLTARVIVVHERDGFYSTNTCEVDADSDTTYGTVMDRFRTKEVKVNGTTFLIPEMTNQVLAELPFSKYIACNKSGPNFDLNEERKGYLEALLHIQDIARGLGKNVFLLSATLLGWYRHCSFLEDMETVVLGMFDEDFDKYFHNSFRTDPNIEGNVFGKVSEGMQYKLKVFGCRLDIIIMYRDKVKGVYWTEEVDDTDSQTIRLMYPEFEVCSGLLHGNVIHVPCPVVHVLEFLYGKHWSSPLNSFDWKVYPRILIRPDRLDSKQQQPPFIRDLDDKSIMGNW